jgi:hypothetical protein
MLASIAVPKAFPGVVAFTLLGEGVDVPAGVGDVVRTVSKPETITLAMTFVQYQ